MAAIDLVEWRPKPGTTTFAYRYPVTNLSTYTQLLVAESQEAVLISKGQFMGRFGPGKHTLDTENLPFLRKFFGIPFGGKNPFTAEVWFVNKLTPLNIDWETDSMMHHDPDYQTMVPMVAKGRYGLRVDHAEKFLGRLVGTAESYDSAQLTDQFYGQLVAATKTLLLQYMLAQGIGIRTVSACLLQISQALQAAMAPFWAEYGFSLTAFYLTTVEVAKNTPEGQRILDAMGRQSAQVIGGYSWQQARTIEATEAALQNGAGQGGLLSALMMSSMLQGVHGQTQQPVLTALPGTHTPVAAGNPLPTAAARAVFCAGCAEKFSSADRFCAKCGKPYHPCPRCGSDNDTQAARCVVCGVTLASSQAAATLASLCGRCQTPLAPSAAFCPKCGKKA